MGDNFESDVPFNPINLGKEKGPVALVAKKFQSTLGLKSKVEAKPTTMSSTQAPKSSAGSK